MLADSRPSRRPHPRHRQRQCLQGKDEAKGADQFHTEGVLREALMGIEAMEAMQREETAYWLGMAMHRKCPRRRRRRRWGVQPNRPAG